jgi:HPt (histidine-containing phosphotransfer) domain-containing protein
MVELLAWDPTTLNKMVGNDAAMHYRMLTLFLRDAAKQVPAIELAAAQGEMLKAAQVAHVLKTSTRMVGALQMGQLCEAIETAGDAQQDLLCRALVSQLAITFANVQEKICAQMLAAGPP